MKSFGSQFYLFFPTLLPPSPPATFFATEGLLCELRPIPQLIEEDDSGALGIESFMYRRLAGVTKTYSIFLRVLC